MLNKRAFLAISSAAIITTACAAPVPDAKGTGLVAKGYQISDVNVVLAKDAAVGRFEKDPALTKKTVQSIDDTLSSKLVKPSGGSKKAKLNIEIIKMELRSAGGRTLTAVENQIIGNVVATDSKGQIIDTQQVFFAQKGARNTTTFNGIPIGILASAVVNAGKSGSGADVKTIVDGFNNKVQAWVTK
jgi:hypothetical protein